LAHNQKNLKIILFLFSVALLISPATVTAVEPLSAVAGADSREVFKGEPFRFQVQVSGSEQPGKPDLSRLQDFQVRELGGQQNSSHSVSIINGRMSQVTHLGYIFSYELTPVREGRLTIPAIAVQASGQTVFTNPVPVFVKKPVETGDFKLRLKLSRSECYVGQPVILTVTWYLGKDVKGFSFALPVLHNKSIAFEDPKVDTDNGGQFYRIPLGGHEVVGIKGRGRIGGREYATITFQKVLTPRVPGPVRIEPATVVCEALTGYRRSRMNGFFDDRFFKDFFNDDFFGGGRSGVYQKIVVPSNALNLRVSALPPEGRPKNFAGHVGEYRIEATATPTEASVGDPITLTLTMSGPEYLEHVSMPPLNRQASLTRDFKIPREMASGRVTGGKKIFTQTIRALRPDVRRIPSIELPYFDTRSGRYRIARTAPIPIRIKATRIITARDAEGRTLSPSGGEVEAWTRGIAFNYEDRDSLEDQRYGPDVWLGSRAWIAILFLPPFGYAGLLTGAFVVRRRRADPGAVRSRKAYGKFVKALSGLPRERPEQVWEPILDAMRNYLGDKCGIPPGALTFQDAEGPLKARGVDSRTLEELGAFFRRCEAGRYAGHVQGTDAFPMITRAAALAKRLDKSL